MFGGRSYPTSAGTWTMDVEIEFFRRAILSEIVSDENKNNQIHSGGKFTSYSLTTALNMFNVHFTQKAT